MRMMRGGDFLIGEGADFQRRDARAQGMEETFLVKLAARGGIPSG